MMRTLAFVLFLCVIGCGNPNPTMVSDATVADDADAASLPSDVSAPEVTDVSVVLDGPARDVSMDTVSMDGDGSGIPLADVVLVTDVTDGSVRSPDARD